MKQYLPRHIELSRPEPGCIHFDVVQTEAPFVWTVAQQFEHQVAFDSHQKRVKNSEWGRATAGIKRDYVVSRVHSET